MDPLSIIASSIAIAEVVAKAARKVQELLGARDSVQSLVDEVTKLDRVLKDAKGALSERKKHGQLPQNCVDAGTLFLAQAQDQLDELSKLLNGCIKSGANAKHKLKLAHIAWMTSQKRIKKLEQGLMDSRLALSTFWGAVQVLVHHHHNI